jgi:hypothetical protein
LENFHNHFLQFLSAIPSAASTLPAPTPHLSSTIRYIALERGARTKSGLRRQGKSSRSWGEGRWGWQKAGWASKGWVSEEWASEGWVSKGLAGAWSGSVAATVACRRRWRSMSRSLWGGRGASALFSTRPKFISGHPIGRRCATQPASSCRGARLMRKRAAWPAQRMIRLW